MNNDEENANAQGAFRISKKPVTKQRDDALAQESPAIANQLPRSYGTPFIFAVARDPKSIFVYWDIDWTEAFAHGSLADRKVFLRVCDPEGSEIERLHVEPMAGMADFSPASVADSCLIEIGYIDPEKNWHALAVSNPVAMPPNKIGALAPGDFALVPFHITFQRLTDLFRATKNPDESLTQSLTRLGETATDSRKRSVLSAAEREMYRAMKASSAEQNKRHRNLSSPAEEKKLQKKLERVIGFGGSSPHHSLGGSS